MTSTFVNDLRLNEMGTGDQSGTWGNVTNTNLELIAEALGFGTEAITTNADTHTTTIADGATDPGRSIYIKYTGTLDSTCTITIGPNTISRLHIIENATSGSQDIIISQGSGANVTIGNGAVKAVYLDGAGSGAAVNDALVDLDLTGTTTVAALTSSGVITGTTLEATGDTSAGDNAAIGYTAAEGLILTGQGSTNDVTIKNDADADVIEIPTGTTNVTMAGTLDVTGDITGSTLNADGDTSAGDAAAIGYTASEGLVLTGQGSTNDVTIKNDADAAVIQIPTGATGVTMAGTLGVTGAVTANAGVVIDNITIDGTEIDLSSGDLTIDVAGDITLDAGGEQVIFKDGSANVGHVDLDSDNFTLKSLVSDKDFIVKGNDGGSEITALTLDMSEAGAATFNNNVTAFSDIRLKSDINTLEFGLEKVNNLRGVTYTRDGRENIGVIAQEVEEVLPNIVLTADDEMGTKSVDYSRITAVLIEAVKELTKRVEELENK
jgi:hypothetical protein